jgi:hypothetical protein
MSSDEFESSEFENEGQATFAESQVFSTRHILTEDESGLVTSEPYMDPLIESRARRYLVNHATVIPNVDAIYRHAQELCRLGASQEWARRQLAKRCSRVGLQEISRSVQTAFHVVTQPPACRIPMFEPIPVKWVNPAKLAPRL